MVSPRKVEWRALMRGTSAPNHEPTPGIGKICRCMDRGGWPFRERIREFLSWTLGDGRG